MSFYSLSQLVFTSPYFSAMECFQNGKKAIYCSSELTSGLRLYSAMESEGIGSLKDLKSKYGDEWCDTNVFNVNKDEANKFAASIREDWKDGTPIITPAPLEVPGWEQPEYLAFWEELIRTRVTAVHFRDKWEYSNGCSFEYAVALDAKIDRFDQQGQFLEKDKAISYVRDAIDTIAKMKGNFDTAKLKKHLKWIEEGGSSIATTTKIQMPTPKSKVTV
jgi:hypothetical protein